VEYLQHGQTRHAHVTNEIILAGGVFNSPHLLMLSGIGPAAVLHRIGIAPLLDLPGVGANLQDHCAAMFLGLRRHPGPFHHAMRADRIAGSLARAYMFGSGFAADVPGGSFGFLKSDPSEPIPDIQLILNLAPPDAAPYLHPRLGSFTDGFNCMVALLRPHSRGGVSLASADPLAAPVIRPNLLAAARDLDVLKRGLRIVRDLAASFPLQAFIGQEIVAPGTAGTTDAALEAHIRTFAVTVNHPLGTCKMGTDRDREAVVDDQLRVRGAQGLRVVDASVMPDAIGGNINAAVIMIAERAADLIKAAADPAAIDTRMAA
jgi:choline dehydrogenase-like flavoprotein